MIKRRVLLTLLLVAALAAAATPLAAHTRLERSVPAAGDTLRSGPAELRLVFSQAVAPRYTTLVLRGPDGAVVPTPALLADSTRREYALPAPPLALPGAYTVEWRTTAADGHVISGSFLFLYAPDPRPAEAAGGADAGQAGTRTFEATSPAPATGAHDRHEHHLDPQLLPAPLRPDSWQNVLARTLQFAALLGLIGLAAFRLALLPRIEAPAEVRDQLRRALRRFGALTLTLLLLTLPVRLWLQAAALHGPELAFERGLLGSLLLDLNWGQAWLVQFAAAAFATVAVIAGLTPLLALAAFALAFTPAFQGHAAAVEGAPALAVLADGLHVFAAGAWLGTLAVLLFAGIPTFWRHAGSERARHIRDLVHRFSPMALTAAALLALSGVVSASLHLHAPAQLLDTGYGRMLLLKLGLVAIIMATGWYNWRRARPRLGTDASVAGLYSGATIELLAAGATVAATALLVALPTP